MKTALFLTLATLTFSQYTEAKPFIGTVNKYIVVKTNKIIDIGTHDISDDEQSANPYDYSTGKKINLQMSEVSKSTREEIAGVKAGEMVLINTGVASKINETVTRYCEVYYLFENKQAYIGCKTYAIDAVNGYQTPQRLDYIINNVEQGVVAEIETAAGFTKGEVAELKIDTKNAKAGRNVKILAIFANDEVLVQKYGFNVLDTGPIVYKSSVDKINIADLNRAYASKFYNLSATYGLA
ncbi:MAG: hypothetical protein HOP07_05865 [Bacteriovoracaceae bacterium]|nr:hypothetical protein [Bacteriovoracaceae bacterium]